MQTALLKIFLPILLGSAGVYAFTQYPALYANFCESATLINGLL